MANKQFRSLEGMLTKNVTLDIWTLRILFFNFAGANFSRHNVFCQGNETYWKRNFLVVTWVRLIYANEHFA